MQTLESTPDDPVAADPPTHRWQRVVIVLVAVVVVCGVVVPADVWFRGGTHLHVPGGYGYGVPTLAVGQSVTFGVQMETSGGPSVVVKSANSDHGNNVSVQYAIFHNAPGAPGVGLQYEPVRGAIPLTGAGVRVAAPAPPRTETTCTTGNPTTPSRCTPASGPDLGATWLVVTVTRLGPGPWSVSHVTVNYSSWLRNRTASSSMTADSNEALLAPAP